MSPDNVEVPRRTLDAFNRRDRAVWLVDEGQSLVYAGGRLRGGAMLVAWD
jgi:hypothetical protein